MQALPSSLPPTTRMAAGGGLATPWEAMLHQGVVLSASVPKRVSPAQTGVPSTKESGTGLQRTQKAHTALFVVVRCSGVLFKGLCSVLVDTQETSKSSHASDL